MDGHPRLLKRAPGRLANRLARLLRPVAMAVGLGVAAMTPALAQHMSYNLPPDVSADQVARMESVRRGLFARIQANPSDLDAAFKYAALSARLGDFEAAISTYERMLIAVPGTPRLQLELGALYYRLGSLEVAQGYFDRVAARSDVPDPVRQRIEAYDRAIKTQKKETTGFSARITMGGRYQTNANSAPTGATVSLLDGFEFVLDEDSRGASDISALLSGQMRYKLPISRHGDVLEFGVAGSLSQFRDRDELISRVVEARVGPEFSLNRFGLKGARLSLHAVAGSAWLGGARYVDSKGISMGYRMPVGRRMQASALVEWRDEDYRNSTQWARAADLSGHRLRVNAILTRQLSADWQVFGGFTWERRTARVDYHAYRETGLQAGFSHRYAPLIGEDTRPWTVSALARIARRDNDAPNPLVSRRYSQESTEYTVQLVQTIPLTEKAEMQFYAGWRGANSNYDLRDYDDRYLGFSLSQSF